MKDEFNIDYGLDNYNSGLDKMPKRKYDPKDPFGMNGLADDMKKDLGETVKEIAKDVKDFKADMKPIYDDGKKFYLDVKKFFAERKAKKEIKNIIIFAQNVRNLRKQNEPKPRQ